jgi:hypothetical protein
MPPKLWPHSRPPCTSVSWWAGLKAFITGSIVAVSARVPSNATTNSANVEAPLADGW